MGTLGRPAALKVEPIGRRLVEVGLGQDDSLLTPGVPIWTLENLDQLVAEYVEKPDAGDGDFWQKLEKQLADASPAVIQLFAELLLLQCLPIRNLGGQKKVTQIEHVLEIGRSPVPIPNDVRDALLSGGVFHGGQAFTTQKWAQLKYLIEFARHFKSLPADVRDNALADPLAFRDEVRAVATGQATQRQSLLYLTFPRFFLPIVKDEHRKAIRDCFADDYLGGPIGDVDDDLADIYAALVEAEGGEVDLYQPPWIDRWQKSPEQPAPKPPKEDNPSSPTSGSGEPRLPDATAELANRLHVGMHWLQDCIDLLRHRRQLIFYGPPGTGKTYLAQELARHVTDESQIKLVQFHPAYSYEDFFEGFRPKSSGAGQIAFELKPGPLRLLVNDAAANPDVAHVLIIDEINRGNLPKIFGELYFLLEYRDRSIDLMYSADSTEPFSLPKNIFVIGTMNTADRSIALVDAALRRRFAFLPLHPSEQPTSEILRNWLKSKGRPMDLADLHEALNARISDQDFSIGPSYFMRERLLADTTGAALQLMWRTDILPLLEEHHYGDPSVNVAKQYRLDALQKGAVAEPSHPESEGDGAGPNSSY
ncbi:McrB family protein [Mycobacterium sp. SMC-13]|uniref:McrB family protein n=1 Tax=Mycobacterium sp. SMC-13 TaxID=3381626 RepID=UPI003877095C